LTIAAESEEIPYYPLDIDMTAFAELVKILSALGNEDALAIFLYTSNGISSSKEAIQTLGLTQKRFYSRLKDLIDNKLVEKVEGEYRHTALGRILCDLGLSLEELLVNKEKLEIINQLNRANISEKEREDLMNLFSINSIDTTSDIKIISSFEELVSKTVDMIQKSKRSVLLATQYVDHRVIDTSFHAVERGVKIKGIISQADNFTQVMKIVFSLMTNPKQAHFLTKFLKSDDFQTRFTKIPYTFLTVDSKYSIIEIKNPVTDQYEFALIINNEVYSRKMENIFNSLWDMASDIKNKLQL
jgi:predicted transcriptional regulator